MRYLSDAEADTDKSKSEGLTPLHAARWTNPTLAQVRASCFIHSSEGSLPFAGSCGKCHWLSSHRTTLPVRAVQVTTAPWTDLVATVVYKMLYVMGSNGLQHQLVPCLWGRTKILDLKLVSLADSGSVCVVEHVFL